MPSSDNPKDTPAEKLASELKDGLKSCRAVLNDYRAKLAAPPVADTGDQGEEDPTDPA